MFKKEDFETLQLKEITFHSVEQEKEEDPINMSVYFVADECFFSFKIYRIDEEIIQILFPSEMVYSESMRVELSILQHFIMDFIKTKSPFRLRCLMEEWILSTYEDELWIYDLEKYAYATNENNRDEILENIQKAYKDALELEKVEEKKRWGKEYSLIAHGKEGEMLKKMLIQLGIAIDVDSEDTWMEYHIRYNEELHLYKKRAEFFGRTLQKFIPNLSTCTGPQRERKKLLPQ